MIDRKKVYEKTNGKCSYCGCDISFKQMQVDHIYPKHLATKKCVLDNDRIENLMPSCRKCNIHKGGMSIDMWRYELNRQVAMLKNNAQFDRALRFNQIKILSNPIVFYYEYNTMSNSESTKC